MVKENTKTENTNQDHSPDKVEPKEIKIEDSKPEKKEKPGRKAKKSKSIKEKYEEKILQLETELKNCEDKYLRLYSDFDNFRRRTSKERIELSKTASADTIGSLLTVVDDFERALNAMKDADNIEAVKEGVDLIYNKLSDILKRQGLEEMHSIGEEFNTDYHEAITNMPAESEELKGKIIDQIEKGYLLKGNVLRFAKVVVGS